LAERLAAIPLAALVTSPLQRCLETLAPVLAPGDGATPVPPRPHPQTDDRLGECHYGDWTGRSLKDLAKDPLWRVVQGHPSAVTFPGADAAGGAGESMSAMQARALDAVRGHDATVSREHGDHAVWLAVSHGDVIKAILADALGMHLDAFQRIVVDPASVSVVRYTPLRPFVVRMNDTGGALGALVPPPPKRRRTRTGSTGSGPSPRASDAVVGGGAGGETGRAATA
jgi:probable phosphomutase (TIGR03848 family)